MLEATGEKTTSKSDEIIIDKLTLTEEDQGKEGDDDKEAGKVYIVPTLQMNVINYREDEHTFLAMLKDLLLASPEMRMKLATGYLNL